MGPNDSFLYGAEDVVANTKTVSKDFLSWYNKAIGGKSTA